MAKFPRENKYIIVAVTKDGAPPVCIRSSERRGKSLAITDFLKDVGIKPGVLGNPKRRADVWQSFAASGVSCIPVSELDTALVSYLSHPDYTPQIISALTERNRSYYKAKVKEDREDQEARKKAAEEEAARKKAAEEESQNEEGPEKQKDPPV